MTGDREALRRELVSALREWAEAEGFPGLTWGPYADTVLPVVERAVTAARAEALRDLAAEMDGAVRLCRVPMWEVAEKLRARADALTAVIGNPAQAIRDALNGAEQ